MLRFLLVLLIGSVWSLPRAERADCPSTCKLPACQCSSTEIPGNLAPKDTPQIVYLTFDDAVTAQNNEFYKQIFPGKKNPDGCPITGTFFVSHKYCDYSIVHELYKNGHEIALHSITHQPPTDYWRTASVQLLKDEFGGLKTLINHFANIPNDDMVGIRLPFLQMSGDNYTQALKELSLKYDCSWPTLTYRQPGLWPYTLDNPSSQDCSVGPCPEKSVPGLWIQPMIDWVDNKNVDCAMTDACVNIPDDVDGLYKFMMDNFNVQYEGNRAPFGFYTHAAWFQTNENHFKAYLKFVDTLVAKNDVYIVNVARGLEYAKNPKPLSKIKDVWKECNKPKDTVCTPKVCQLKMNEETFYMTSCASNCPKSYPWLGNPLGEK